MDEKYKFDFLEFHLAQVIGKDGAATSFTVEDAKLYTPARLRQQMTQIGQKDPNEAIQTIFFKRRRLADDSDCDIENYLNNEPQPLPTSASGLPIVEKKKKKVVKKKELQDPKDWNITGNKLSATTLLKKASENTTAWSDDDSEIDYEDIEKKEKMIELKKRLQKAERK